MNNEEIKGIKEDELPVKLLNVIILSGLIENDITESVISLKDGTNIKKVEFQLKFCGKNSNQINTHILVAVLGNKGCDELLNLMPNLKNKPVTVVGSLNALYGGPSLVNENNTKLMINASKVNIESFSIDCFNNIDLSTIKNEKTNEKLLEENNQEKKNIEKDLKDNKSKSDSSETNNPWGI